MIAIPTSNLKLMGERETVQEGKKAKTVETKESRDDEQTRDDRKEKRE